MQISVRHALLLVAAGAAFSLLLQWGALGLGRLAVPSVDAVVPHWYALSSSAVQALVAVTPALLVGFFAQTRGALLGLITGIFGALLFSAFVSVNWGSLEGTGLGEHLLFFGQLILLALGSGIVGLVAGAAGQLFAAKRAL